MEERLQLVYMKVKHAKELWEQLTVDYKLNVKRLKFRFQKDNLQAKLKVCGDITTCTLCTDGLVQDWNLSVDADEEETADYDMQAEQMRKKVTVMPDGEHILYLLYGIPNNGKGRSNGNDNGKGKGNDKDNKRNGKSKTSRTNSLQVIKNRHVTIAKMKAKLSGSIQA
ncbi:hypothetical protein K440DRAFT_645426 [Wilcoxina mikolae CBS 423.85]|nr:hypothetical protein K440DRAFT_645426 [Wilcoxina mikolae CBS 423.85]